MEVAKNKGNGVGEAYQRCTFGMLMWDTFSVCFLNWADITSEYIKLVKGGLQEFRRENHHHYKKFNDSEQACANPPPKLKNRVEDWHFLSDHYAT
ncbi:CACTA en-spm transposon protein [Cucumis melo var. makuwa]|uniref:CACTA en-spm transposon protein n=1 Tax=Cucumis melo var. makuwa TaxID=1194695 RepID=A0A5D3CDE1_CUCMM|nr:CACTA en-spm transposon protein [Cucumis melo var. makuwa]TYK08366.1 CACTA en-spm transposon protein [Cucumis melo var. makuwa]